MATDFDNSRHQYEMYRWAYENGHRQWVEQAAKCFNFWKGEQWNPIVKQRLENAKRPALTFNVIESLIRSMKGVQRALRNDVRFMPIHGSPPELARVYDAVWLSIQNGNQFDFLETDLYEKGLIMGRAYYDVRVDFSESLQGNVRITSPRSQDVVLDPSVETYDPKDWPRVFTKSWVSYDDIVAKYGKEKAEAIGYVSIPDWYDYEDSLAAQQMGQMPQFHYEGMTDTGGIRAYLMLSQQYFKTVRKDVFVDTQTGDTSEIPETWDYNRVSHALQMVKGLATIKRDVRSVRWRVTCEGTVLHDDDSPYKQFTVIPYFPTFVDGVSKGAVDSLIDPQELFNKVTSQELHIINTTANSGWKYNTGSILNMTREELAEGGSATGLVLEMTDINAIEKIQPSQTPTGHDRLSFKADKIMRDISGMSNQARGFAREDVAGEAILANQAAQDINFAGWLSNLHRTKQMVASFAQEQVQAHYSETRVIQINRGSAFAPNMESVTINEPTAEGRVLNDVTQGKYTTVLVPAPSRTTMTSEDFELLVKLRSELGIAIPDSVLIELSPAANKAQIIQMLQGDSNERQRQQEQDEAEIRALEKAKLQATAHKEQTAGDLNTSRAQKFMVEAQSDPDASYERVEAQRIEAEDRQAQQRFQLDVDKFEHQKEKDADDLAVRLTQIDAQREAKAQSAKSSTKKTP